MSGNGKNREDGGLGAEDGGLGAELGRRLAEGDLSAAPAVLNLLESTAPADRLQAAALMEAVSPAKLGHEAAGQIVGVTGPPGAGKSTLLSALTAHLRHHGTGSVAILAVDPSSRRSGGSLLGDRARIELDPADKSLFIRSTAAGDRLGGLAPATRAAAQALAVAFELVLIETVGVGQAETDVAEVADTVIVVVQPGGGDVLQFIKSGIMETPDILVITKSDLGTIARQTQRDLRSALRSLGSRSTPVIALSALPPATEMDALAQELAQSRLGRDLPARRRELRRSGALRSFAIEYGQRAIRALGGPREVDRILQALDPDISESQLEAALAAELERRQGHG